MIEYKALHFNQATWERMRANDLFRQRISSSVWNKIGKAILDFDIKFGDETLPKGTYDFGIDIDANDTFAIVLAAPAGPKKIKLQTITGDNLSGEYLSVNKTPTNSPDGFIIGTRCGKFRGWQSFHVSYLAPHDHAGDRPASKP